MNQEADRGAEAREVPTVAGPQAISAVTPREPPASAPPILSEPERALLVAALDRIVPAEGDMPGAGTLGVAAVIERTLATSLPLRRLCLDGLLGIALETARRVPDGAFAALDAEAQEEIMRAVEAAHPAFFAALVDHTYRGYYTDPRVHALLGWEHRPPQPLGHHLHPFDPDLLIRQRDRAPFWRTVESTPHPASVEAG